MAFRGIRFVPDGTKIDFVRQRFVAFAFSGLLLLAAIASLAVQGLNLGIDFKGGVLIEAASPAPVDLGELRGRISGLGLGEVDLQQFGAPNQLLIRVQAQNTEEASKAAVDAIRGSLGRDWEYRRVELVGPKVGGELFRDGVTATVLAVLAIGIYVYLRFEWQFALAALVATGHDVLMALGLFSLLGLDFNLTAIAALLALAGYSVNDTVVVFDRIRELLRRHKTPDMAVIVNQSINQTLARTILTSGTTLLAVLPLLLFGGSALFNFSLAVFWGILIGTFSSVYVAGALLLYLPSVRRPESGAVGDGLPVQQTATQKPETNPSSATSETRPLPGSATVLRS
ncbi:MAG: protein translocase subunit SecF [Alphaproteobacteria bacterium]